MAEPTDPEPAPAPEPTPWQRKHRPEPEQPTTADNSSSGGGWKVLSVLASIAVTVIGVVLNLSNRPKDPVLPPVAYKPEEVDAMRRVFDRRHPSAVILAEVERKVAGLEPRMAALEKAVSRVRAFPNGNAKLPVDPDTVELYATLRRVLGDMQAQLTELEPTRLTPDELAKRDQLAERVETLRCTLVAIADRE